MAANSTFNGFPKECVKFYEELKRNNTREWFSERKPDFDNYVTAPARDFVFEMGKRLKEISPAVNADPRLNGSIFRPYRDTRFSKDKTPYKTHLGIFFWEGEGPKMDCPGYYFHLEPPHMMLGAGNHCFSKPLLEAYRDSVVDPKHGAALVKALKTVEKRGDYAIGMKHYKKTPRGYDSRHPNAELLLYNGLTAAVTMPIPRELYSAELLDLCFARFKDISPVVEWLVEMAARARIP